MLTKPPPKDKDKPTESTPKPPGSTSPTKAPPKKKA